MWQNRYQIARMHSATRQFEGLDIRYLKNFQRTFGVAKSLVCSRYGSFNMRLLEDSIISQCYQEERVVLMERILAIFCKHITQVLVFEQKL